MRSFRKKVVHLYDVLTASPYIDRHKQKRYRTPGWSFSQIGHRTVPLVRKDVYAYTTSSMDARGTYFLGDETRAFSIMCACVCFQETKRGRVPTMVP